jgi:hypothetical protein
MGDGLGRSGDIYLFWTRQGEQRQGHEPREDGKRAEATQHVETWEEAEHQSRSDGKLGRGVGILPSLFQGTGPGHRWYG